MSPLRPRESRCLSRGDAPATRPERKRIARRGKHLVVFKQLGSNRRRQQPRDSDSDAMRGGRRSWVPPAVVV